MKKIFRSQTSNTHFLKKGCAHGLILKVRVFRTRKWPKTAFFARVGTHADVRKVDSLIRVFRCAGRHKHPLIFATGLKSRTNQVQTAGTIEEIETSWTRVRVARCVCINTFVNGLYKVFYAFLFLTKQLRKCIQRDALHNSKAALWLVIEFKGMFFPHKMRMKMCISVIRWFSLK